MGLYESTVMDTVEKKIPWYHIALAIGLPATAYGARHQFGAVEESLAGKSNISRWTAARFARPALPAGAWARCHGECARRSRH